MFIVKMLISINFDRTQDCDTSNSIPLEFGQVILFYGVIIQVAKVDRLWFY